MKKLKLDAICIDGGTQCRVVIDQPTVYDYAEHMKDGDVFPPIETVFDGTTHWLTDGFHRWHAYKINGVKEVDVIYKPGTKEDAILEALKANSKHGKTLTNEDKRKKVLMALEIPGFAEKTNYEIAKICDLSRTFVAAMRDPEVKERQEKNRQKSAAKKAQNSSPTTSEQKAENSSPTTIDPHAGAVPDADEIKASDRKSTRLNSSHRT